MSIRQCIGIATALIVLTAVPRSATSKIVVNNGAPNGQAGFDIFNDFRAADDFTVATALQFNEIRFWGLLPAGSTYAPSIFWQILSDAGGTPGSTVVASGAGIAATALRASLPNGFDSWQLDLAVGPQVLGPGIFWLALHDGAVGDITDSSLLWEMTGGRTGSEFAVDFIPASEWTGDWGGDLAFQLQNTTPVTATPEPATMSLVAIGFGGLAAVRRRHRRKR
jgi:hypothetical protein